MTVQDLIDALEAVEDKSLPVVVSDWDNSSEKVSEVSKRTMPTGFFDGVIWVDAEHIEIR